MNLLSSNNSLIIHFINRRIIFSCLTLFHESIMVSSLGVGQSKESIVMVICSPVGPYYKTGFSAVSLYADGGFVRAWLEWYSHFIGDSLYIHYTFIVHSLYIHYTFIIHSSYIHYTFIVHSSYIHRTFIIHITYIHHTHNLHNLQSIEPTSNLVNSLTCH